MRSFHKLHFSLRHIVTAYLSTKVFGDTVYTVRHGLLKGMKRKGGLGFVPIDVPATAETTFLRKMDCSGTVYDVGAFEGVMSLFFAQRATLVIAFEPNPRNYRRCLENLELNGVRNVTVLNRGLSDVAGTLELSYDPLMPGASSGDPAIREQIAEVSGASTVSITVGRLDDALPGPPPDLIKIDIEGMEYKALRGMEQTLRRYRPRLYVELHGATIAEKTEIARSVIGFIESLGYTVNDIEQSREINLATLDHRPSHIYATPAQMR